MWVFPGGRQELGETIAQCAVREAAEEVVLAASGQGLAVSVVDPLCPVYTATDVLHRDGTGGALAYHYAILHVLACVDVPAGGGGGAQLPALRAASDASAAAWVDIASLVLEECGRRGACLPPSAGGAALVPTGGPPHAPTMAGLAQQGVLVPLTERVTRLAVHQWQLRGFAVR